MESINMEPVKSHRGGCVAILIVVAWLLPLAYLLSVGPAIWLRRHDYISDRAYMVYCYPFDVVLTHCRPLATPLNWYERQFLPMPPHELGRRLP
jgi:hypothetical protein